MSATRRRRSSRSLAGGKGISSTGIYGGNNRNDDTSQRGKWEGGRCRGGATGGMRGIGPPGCRNRGDIPPRNCRTFHLFNGNLFLLWKMGTFEKIVDQIRDFFLILGVVLVCPGLYPNPRPKIRGAAPGKGRHPGRGCFGRPLQKVT